jgi:hypothetical protein
MLMYSMNANVQRRQHVSVAGCKSDRSAMHCVHWLLGKQDVENHRPQLAMLKGKRSPVHVIASR